MTITSSAKTGPMARALLAFAAVIIVANVAIGVFSYFWPTVEIPNAMGIILLVAAASMGGQAYASTVGRKMTLGERSLFALGATVISLVLMAAMVYGIFAYAGVPVSYEGLSLLISGTTRDANEIREWGWVVVAGIAAVTWLLTWLGALGGSRMAIKARDARAAKGL